MRIALVVGNASYVHAAKLANAHNDAQAFAEKLRRLDFGVDLQLDLNLSQFLEVVENFEEKIKGADVGLFYFAGHGFQYQGLNYLAPIDAKIERQNQVASRTVHLTELLGGMSEAAQISLVFLDACRDSPFSRSIGARVPAREMMSASRGLARIEDIDAVKGTFIAFATDANGIAMDGEGPNSPFTAALVKHIETPETSVGDMMIKVRDEVIRATEGMQRPMDQSSLRQVFFFNPGLALERRMWSALSHPATSIFDVEAFISHFPNSVHRLDAEQKFDAILRANATADALEEYLDRYSASTRKSAVEHALAVVLWKELKKSWDEDALRDFINRFSTTELRQPARERLAGIMWSNTRRTTDTTTLDVFLAEFSDTRAGLRAAERRRILGLPFLERWAWRLKQMAAYLSDPAESDDVRARNSMLGVFLLTLAVVIIWVETEQVAQSAKQAVLCSTLLLLLVGYAIIEWRRLSRRLFNSLWFASALVGFPCFAFVAEWADWPKWSSSSMLAGLGLWGACTLISAVIILFRRRMSWPEKLLFIDISAFSAGFFLRAFSERPEAKLAFGLGLLASAVITAVLAVGLGVRLLQGAFSHSEQRA